MWTAVKSIFVVLLTKTNNRPPIIGRCRLSNGRYRLSASLPIIGRYRLSADNRCTSTNNYTVKNILTHKEFTSIHTHTRTHGIAARKTNMSAQVIYVGPLCHRHFPIHRVAQNKIPQQTICNFSATSCPILKNSWSCLILTLLQIEQCTMYPPHLNYATTLPCKLMQHESRAAADL